MSDTAAARLAADTEGRAAAEDHIIAMRRAHGVVRRAHLDIEADLAQRVADDLEMQVGRWRARAQTYRSATGDDEGN